MVTVDSLPQKQDRHLTTLVRERISRYGVIPIRGRQTSHGVVLVEGVHRYKPDLLMVFPPFHPICR
jgi:hypothetical protein